MRKFLLGAASGLIAGYALYRACELPRLLTRPLHARPRDAAAYGAVRRALTVAAVVRSLAGTSVVAFGPLGVLMNRSVYRFPLAARAAVFALEGLLLDALVDMPADLVEDYGLEHRYALSDQPLRSWLLDRLKQEAIGGAVTVGLSALFAAAIRRFPTTWPIVAAFGALPLLLLANIVVPIYVFPLFNEYQPMEGPLEQRLRALAHRYGVGNARILRMDMSKQTKKANAFVAGIGNTQRIVVGDTLIEHFPQDEIEFVVAHELGHYVNKDTWRLIAAGEIAAVVLLVGTYAAIGPTTRRRTEDPRTLAAVQWWSMVLSQLLRPALSAFARSREWAADDFARLATGAPRTGASAFARLQQQNLAEEEQPGWYEFLFSTHPSLRARIDALNAPG